MSPTDHLQLIEWLLGGGGAVIFMLLGAVAWFYQRALDGEKDRTDNLEKKFDSQIHDINVEHRETVKRLADDLKALEARHNDVDVTVAGFGGSFLPRREWELERERLERHGRDK